MAASCRALYTLALGQKGRANPICYPATCPIDSERQAADRLATLPPLGKGAKNTFITPLPANSTADVWLQIAGRLGRAGIPEQQQHSMNYLSSKRAVEGLRGLARGFCCAAKITLRLRSSLTLANFYAALSG